MSETYRMTDNNTTLTITTAEVHVCNKTNHKTRD